MDALFPLKNDIPDNEIDSIIQNKKQYLRKYSIISFLLSYEENESIKIINQTKRTYPLGKIEKNEKAFFIDYIELLDGNDKDDMKIEINNKSFFIEKSKYNICDNSIIFIFNNFLEDKKDKRKLNCFNINEEFEIYYKIHSEKNKTSFKYLIKTVEFLFKNEDPNIDFSLFLTILKKNIKLEFFDDILKCIKNKGDLTKISKEDINKIISQDEKKYFIIKLIYITFQDIDELKHLLNEDGKMKFLLFECLEKYKIFAYNLELYPKYSFLIGLSDSINDIKIILKCSRTFSDLVYLINEKKKEISRLIKKEYEIVLEDFYNLKGIFIQAFDEKFYLALNLIKEFETANNVKLFHLAKVNDNEYYFENSFIREIAEGQRMSIILYLRNELNMKEYYSMVFEVKNDALTSEGFEPLNNFEKILMIDILLNYLKDKNKYQKQCLDYLLFLVNRIELKNISKEFKIIFFKMKWEKIFQHSKIFAKILSLMKDSLNSIKDFKFLFGFVDKLIEKVKDSKIKGVKLEKNKQKEKIKKENIENDKESEKENEDDEDNKKKDNFELDNYKNNKNENNIEAKGEILEEIIDENKKEDIEDIENKKENENKNNNNQDEIQNNDIKKLYKKTILLIVKESQKKILEFLDNINDDKINEIIEIMIKLIYLSDKYIIMNNLLNTIIRKLEMKVLNDIIIETLTNYEISNDNFENIITILIKNNKFGKIHELLRPKFISKFEKLINQHIINHYQLFDEKENFNFLLLYNLNKNDFFKFFPSSHYVIETIKNLENIRNKAILLKGISYNEILSLNHKLELLSSVTKNDFSIKVNGIINSLNNTIKIIEDILTKIDAFINDFQKIKFLYREKIIKWANDLKDEIKNKEINDFKKKIKSITTAHKLFKDLEEKINSNILIKMFDIKKGDEKGEEKKYSLIEQIILFLYEEKYEEINIDSISSLLVALPKSDLEKKKSLLKTYLNAIIFIIIYI